MTQLCHLVCDLGPVFRTVFLHERSKQFVLLKDIIGQIQFLTTSGKDEKKSECKEGGRCESCLRRILTCFFQGPLTSSAGIFMRASKSLFCKIRNVSLQLIASYEVQRIIKQSIKLLFQSFLIFVGKSSKCWHWAVIPLCVNPRRGE